MVDYVWTIETCENEVITGGIIRAHWRCRATEGDTVVEAYGTCDFFPHPELPEFKPYNEVTESDVQLWLASMMDKGVVEAGLAEQIAEKNNPVILFGTPW
jgi:hypothetical protein